jgi:DNA-binding winged helix-turn-helix (wHTH) protein/TolB-like protein
VAENSLKLLKTTKSEHLPRFYEFGAFRLDAEKRLLWRNDETVSLMPKAFDVLVTLVRRHGQVVTKDDLMASVWRDTVVEENSLNVNVSALRKVFGEKPHEHRFIVTIPGIGYEFVADVREVLADAKEVAFRESAVGRNDAQPLEITGPVRGDATGTIGEERQSLPLYATTATRRAFGLRILASVIIAGGLTLLAYALWQRHNRSLVQEPLKTIAVLPFKPLSADSRDESLEMGMTETLITRLSNLNQIVVRPMSAVRKYNDRSRTRSKQVRSCKTDAILDGNIQKVGNRVRVSVRLTKVSNGASLWAGQFDENFTDIFKVQDSISVRVANALPLKLSGDEQERLSKRYTDNPEAYELYLQGLYYRVRNAEGDKARSLECYQSALEKDPKFALVYVEIAELELAHTGANQIPANETRPKVIANLTKALELDDSLAEGHNMFAEVKYQDQFDWTGAEKEFKRAIELNPNVASIHQAYGWYLMCEGRFDEATKEIERAQEIDPRALIISVVKGRLLYFMRQYDAALQHEQKLLELEPNSGVDHWAIGLVYEQKGMYAEAVEENARAGHVDGLRLSPQEIAAGKEAFKTVGWQGYVRQRIDLLRQKARTVYVSPFSIAVNYARLGNKDEAFAWLEKAIEARASGVSELKIDPVLDNLRSDPRYTKLLERMNLTP